MDKAGKPVIGKKGKPVEWPLHGLVSELWGYSPFEVRFKITNRNSAETILLLLCVAEKAIALGL